MLFNKTKDKKMECPNKQTNFIKYFLFIVNRRKKKDEKEIF